MHTIKQEEFKAVVMEIIASSKFQGFKHCEGYNELVINYSENSKLRIWLPEKELKNCPTRMVKKPITSLIRKLMILKDFVIAAKWQQGLIHQIGCGLMIVQIESPVSLEDLVG